MSRKKYKLRDVSQFIGPDPSVRNAHADPDPNSFVTQIRMGTVLLPMPEPVFSANQVTVEMAHGGIFTNVGWPGPNVSVSPSGIRSPVSIGFHGLFEGPLPGQTVAVGFVEGQRQNPIVIEKYPYANTHNPVLQSAHVLPMTTKVHGPLDVGIGSFTGSYIMIRGTLPIPSQIDIFGLTRVTVDAALEFSVKSLSTTVTSAAIQLGSNAATQPVFKGTQMLVELEKDVAAMTALKTAVAAWIPIPLDGGAAFKALLSTFVGLPMAVFAPTLSTKVFVE